MSVCSGPCTFRTQSIQRLTDLFDTRSLSPLAENILIVAAETFDNRILRLEKNESLFNQLEWHEFSSKDIPIRIFENRIAQIKEVISLLRTLTSYMERKTDPASSVDDWFEFSSLSSLAEEWVAVSQEDLLESNHIMEKILVPEGDPTYLLPSLRQFTNVVKIEKSSADRLVSILQKQNLLEFS